MFSPTQKMSIGIGKFFFVVFLAFAFQANPRADPSSAIKVSGHGALEATWAGSQLSEQSVVAVDSTNAF